MRGNPGKRPLNPDEPKPKRATGRAPRGLGIEGGRFWRKYAPALAALGVLTEVDEPALRMAAEHFEVAVRAAQELREPAPVLDEQGAPVVDADGRPETTLPGLTIDGRDGAKKHPLLQVLRDSSAALRSYLVEFGMTPSSRSRLRVEPAEEQLSLADVLFQAAVAGRDGAALVGPDEADE